jgi:uncharacterized alkaline shock family protein YloU
MSAPASKRTARKRTTSGSVARTGGELVGERGRTAIADTVVAKIAGMAAAEVQGVYALGAGMARAFGAVRERIPGAGGPNLAQWVAVEVGERQAAIDLDVIVDYGVSIPDLADGIRLNVIGTVEKMCGLQVTEVNIAVDDIHLPGEETSEAAEPRVE